MMVFALNGFLYGSKKSISPNSSVRRGDLNVARHCLSYNDILGALRRISFVPFYGLAVSLFRFFWREALTQVEFNL